MMQLRKKTILIFLITILLCGCSHHYYMPNAHFVPLFKEQNEFCITTTVNSGDDIESGEIHGAYSITNHYAIMTNLMFAKGGNSSTNNWGKGKYTDLAFGYFSPINNHGVFEIYSGIGFSNQQHQYGNSSTSFGSSELSFTKSFIQPSLGLTFRYFDIALSNRFCHLKYNKINNRIIQGNNDYNDVEFLRNNRSYFLLEPAITLRGGFQNFKIQFQLNSLSNLTNKNTLFSPMQLSFGLYFIISDRFR